MKLIKKLIDWFEDLLWRQAIKDVLEDVLENPEYYFDNGYKDGDTECQDTK